MLHVEGVVERSKDSSRALETLHRFIRGALRNDSMPSFTGFSASSATLR